MRRGTYVVVLLVAGCSAPVAPRPVVPSRPAPVVAPLPIPPAPALPPPPIRHEKGITRYPVENEGITVQCPIMRVCDIELQPGEVVQSGLVGDPRWLVIASTSGSKESPTPHLGVKPTAKGIRTNLLILTDRRTYQLELVEGGKGGRVGFTYPDERKAVVRVEQIPAQRNERYRVKGAYPWTPEKVSDDGTRTFIDLPASSRVTDLPVLYVTTNGNDELVNYAVQWPRITVGRLFERAALVLGTGWKQQRVEIVRER